MAVRTTAQRVANRILMVGFCVAIALPLAVQGLGLESPASSTEKRALTPLPECPLDGPSIVTFPSRFEAYYSDHFGLRSKLIAGHNLVKVRWLGFSASPQIVIGQDGWLYYFWKPLGIDSLATRPLTPEQLKQWQRLIEARRDWLARQGITYVFVIVPEKQSIYPEYLPSHIKNRGPRPSQLEQVVGHLRAHSNVKVVDLRESLAKARERERVYHLTDSHWNYRGSFAAYQQMISAFGLEALPRSACEGSSTWKPGGDLAAMLGLADQVREEELDLVLREPNARLTDERVAMREEYRLGHLRPLAMERPEVDLPRAVVFHDSFGEDLVPFLSEHFQRTVWIPSYVFDPQVVDREQPKVVFQVVVERQFLADPPTDPIEVQASSR